MCTNDDNYDRTVCAHHKRLGAQRSHRMYVYVCTPQPRLQQHSRRLFVCPVIAVIITFAMIIIGLCDSTHTTELRFLKLLYRVRTAQPSNSKPYLSRYHAPHRIKCTETLNHNSYGKYYFFFFRLYFIVAWLSTSFAFRFAKFQKGFLLFWLRHDRVPVMGSCIIYHFKHSSKYTL